MSYFQVNVEPSGSPDPLEPSKVRHGSYTIVNRHAFATADEAIDAITADTVSPNADVYVVEAETSRDAASLFKSVITSAVNDARVHLVRKSE